MGTNDVNAKLIYFYMYVRNSKENYIYHLKVYQKYISYL